jgi:uncharacterized protein involved in exopolysaccharide biosynthesis
MKEAPMDAGTLMLGMALGFAAGVGITFVWALCASARLADAAASQGEDTDAVEREWARYAEHSRWLN